MLLKKDEIILFIRVDIILGFVCNFNYVYLIKRLNGHMGR